MTEPRKRTAGPDTTPTPPALQAPPPGSTTASITDLCDFRHRRLLAPWPGWWGDAEVRSWTRAERSRRAS
jgi:hypothetical protein